MALFPRLLTLLAFCGVFSHAVRADEAALVRAVPVLALTPAGVAEEIRAAGGEILILVRGARPSALLAEQDGRFILRWPGWVDTTPADGAFVVAGNAAEQLIARWPSDAVLSGRIESVSAGQRVWIDRGRRSGVRSGDVWWQRTGGQPVARFEVLEAADAGSFCRMWPLAGGISPSAGERVELWPSPGERRDGRATSGVAYIAPAASGAVIWIAAPPWAEATPDAQVDFFHGGRYIGSGTVERRDARFWYVRPLDAGAAFAPTVGDTVRIRTSAEVRARRFDAHIVARHPEGFLINSGENDGLRVGDRAVWARGEAVLGELEVTKLQPAHAVVRVPGGGVEALLGDLARFGAATQPNAASGAVTEVPHPQLAIARTSTLSAQPVFELRRNSEFVGLMLEITRVGDEQLLYLIPESSTRAVEIGDAVHPLTEDPPSP